MTVVIVALMLFALAITLGFLVDITGTMFRKQQMQNMAELGSAAGGLMVAERIAELADQNVRNGLFLQPKDDDVNHPERFLTDDQRRELQQDPFAASVIAEAQHYAEKNRPSQLTDLATTKTLYPKETITCGGTKKTVDTETTVRYNRAFILGNLAAWIGVPPLIHLREVGTYGVPLCPER